MKDLKKRLVELENQLQKKDQDLKIYQSELSKANLELEKLIVRVHDQLRQTGKIQKYLVPTEFPNIQGFEFSTKFSSSASPGGDYFDIFEHYDKMRFGLFMSSASGYGMSSLFLSILMKLTYDIEDSINKTTESVLAGILEELEREAPAGENASIFYGVFDRRKFRLTYSNVGQPLLVHYKAADGQIALLKSHRPPYTSGEKLSENTLNEDFIELNPKDKLVLCSEGFMSLTTDQGMPWGIDQILSVVKHNINKDVHGLRNEIFYQASKLGGGQARDLTVIVVEVKERIMKLASELS